MLLRLLFLLLISFNSNNATSSKFSLAEINFTTQLAKFAVEKSCCTYAHLQWIDRASDKLTKIKIKVGNSYSYYGKFRFRVLRCWKSPSSEEEENAAFIDIYEQAGIEKTKKIFSGWIFSNNAFLTNIEHQRYDLRLLDCIS